jgi:hypothetical protein
MAIKADAWQIVQIEVSALPPYLEDNDLTVERFYEKNKAVMTINEARNMLDRLVEAGTLEKQERRNRNKSGARAVVYVVKG